MSQTRKQNEMNGKKQCEGSLANSILINAFVALSSSDFSWRSFGECFAAGKGGGGRITGDETLEQMLREWWFSVLACE